MLIILFSLVVWLIAAGATHGYAQHRWAPKIERRQVRDGCNWIWKDVDDNASARVVTTVFWPFYWIFVWTYTKTSEVTFSSIERHAAKQVARNKSRIEVLQATRKELEESNAELQQAEIDLEQEMAKMK